MLKYLAPSLALLASLSLVAAPDALAQPADELVKVMEQGRIARNNDRFAQGIEAYQKAVEMTERSDEALLALADIYNRGGKHAEAEKVAEELAGKASEAWLKAGGFCQLGIAQLHQGDLQSAQNSFRKAIEAQPDVDTARLNLAYIFDKHGQSKAAEELLAEIPKGDMRPYVDWRQGLLGKHTEAMRVRGPNPGYPASAGQQGIGGRMTFSADVDMKGAVSNVQTVKGLPAGLTESGLKAVKAWTMKPATLNGRTVAGNFEITFLFQGRNMH